MNNTSFPVCGSYRTAIPNYVKFDKGNPKYRQLGNNAISNITSRSRRGRKMASVYGARFLNKGTVFFFFGSAKKNFNGAY